MPPQIGGGRNAPPAAPKRKGQAGGHTGGDRLDPRFEAAGASASRPSPASSGSTARRCAGTSSAAWSRRPTARARRSRRLIAPYEDYLRARVAAWPELSGKRLLREIRGARLRGLLQRRSPTFCARPGRRGPRPFERRFETAAGQAGAGRLRPVQGRVHRRARRRAHPLAVHDGARPQPLALGPVLRHPGSADRPALPHRRLRRHGRRAVRAALRPHEDRGDRRGRRAAWSSYNASLVALLNHYGALPRACRPYRAKTKGKIERPYRYIRAGLLPGAQLPRPRRSRTPSSTTGARRSPTPGSTPPPAGSSRSTSPRSSRR